jgi:hypothetical protein
VNPLKSGQSGPAHRREEVYVAVDHAAALESVGFEGPDVTFGGAAEDHAVTARHHVDKDAGRRVREFVRANPALAARAVLMLNIEHVAQRNFSPSRTVAADGYREAIADSGEAPITPGITNRSPFLDALFDQGVLRYGVNFVSDRSAMQSGETGGYAAITGAKLTVMQAPPLYHTTGEGLDVISTPGLERIARFFAYFVKEVDKAAVAQINP